MVAAIAIEKLESAFTRKRLLLRLRDVLREDFPGVAALLGPEQFDEVVSGYLAAFPSRWPSVRHLGHSLSEFFRHRKDIPGMPGRSRGA